MIQKIIQCPGPCHIVRHAFPSPHIYAGLKTNLAYDTAFEMHKKKVCAYPNGINVNKREEQCSFGVERERERCVRIITPALLFYKIGLFSQTITEQKLR